VATLPLAFSTIPLFPLSPSFSANTLDGGGGATAAAGTSRLREKERGQKML